MTSLGDAWFARCADAMQDVRVPPEFDVRISYSAGPVDDAIAWTEIIHEGRIEWTRDLATDADVVIKWSDVDIARDVLARRVDGDVAAAVTTMAARRAAGPYEGPLPPHDLNYEPSLNEMPVVADADLRLSAELTDGPFGTVHCITVFENGVCTRVELGADAEADAAVAMPFVNLIRMRQGTMNILQAIAGGRIAGSQGALALLAGLVDSPEYKRALAATTSGPDAAALMALSIAATDPAYRSAIDRAFTPVGG